MEVLTLNTINSMKKEKVPQPQLERGSLAV